MSFAFKRQASSLAGKRALVYGAGLFGFGTLSVTNYLTRQSNREQTKIDQAKQNLAEFKVHELKGDDVLDYPWCKDPQEWEYKVVKVRGYFTPARVFIKKTKDGKDGFSVFAPFYTHTNQARFEFDAENETMPPSKDDAGLMINLGWVPSEHKDEIEQTDEPLPLLDLSTLGIEGTVQDKDSGFVYKEEYNEDDGEEPPKYCEVTGILRRGEKWNPLINNVNFPKDKLFQFVDLDLMARFFYFPNVTSSRVAYLERVVPSLEGSLSSNHRG